MVKIRSIAGKLQLLIVCVMYTILVSGQEIQLTKGGKSAYVIVVSATADAQVKRASDILQRYLERMTGVKIPVTNDATKRTKYEILVGESSRLKQAQWKELTNDLQEDGYALKTSGRTLIIAGGKGKGVVFGVTALLEDHLGMRYYSPEVQCIPQIKDLNIPELAETQNPAAILRIIHGTFPDDPDYRDFRRLHTIRDVYDEQGWEGYWVHTFKRLLPAARYFDIHPEYYSLVGGKRVPYGQPCLTNPDVLEITIDNLAREMKEHPTKQYWSVSQEDNYDYCRCDKCAASDALYGGPSGTMLHFVNQVATHFPDKTITTLAYQYTRKPPLNVIPEPNVMITLCTIELNRSKPIASDPGSADFAQDIIGWSKLCNNIMLWDYEVQFTNYLTPFPLFHTLQPNIQFFNTHGTKAHFQQCNVGKGVELSELKAYLLSKLLWNPDISQDQVINEFLAGYYKEAAPFIREYMNLLQEGLKQSDEGLDIYGTPVWNATTFLSAEKIAQYYDLFDKAEAAVASQPDVVERVRVARLSVQFADMEIARTDMFGPRGWYVEKGGTFVLKPEREKLLEDFIATCRRNGIVEMNENGLTTETYYTNMRRFLDVEITGNLAFQKKVVCNPAPDPKYAGIGFGTLTNGVKGTDDYKINWLGWQGKDAEAVVDLNAPLNPSTATVSTLQFPKSWILHPGYVTCSISTNGTDYKVVDTVRTNEDLRKEPLIREFTFNLNKQAVRYVRFQFHATGVLPSWHTYTGNPCWLFVDEITVK